jgi:type I restriction enzyme, S subunit
MEVKPGFKQTEVGAIPEDWEVKRIADFATVGSGGTPSREVAAYWGGSIPWITTSQIDFGAITEADQFITGEGLRNSAAKLLPAGTLLMALYGQGKTRGKVGVLEMPAATNQACASIALHENVSREFILHFLTSRYEDIRNSSNSGSQENLNGNIVKGTPVAFPPLREQRAIATALSDVDGLLGGLDRLIAKKRDLKQAAMQQLLTGQTRLPGFHGEWEVKRLGEVAEVRMCKRIFSEQTSLNGDIPFFKIGTFGKEPDAYISCSLYLEYKRKYSFPNNGDILLSAAGTLGKTVVYDGKPAYFQDSNIVWLETDKEKIVTEYLYHCYQVMLWASPEGSTISRLYNGIICDTVIKLPLLPEQTAIAEVLTAMDAELAALTQRRDKTLALKQAMMQELLTGRTRLIPTSTTEVKS